MGPILDASSWPKKKKKKEVEKKCSHIFSIPIHPRTMSDMIKKHTSIIVQAFLNACIVWVRRRKKNVFFFCNFFFRLPILSKNQRII